MTADRTPIHLTCVVGTRPNFVKIAAILEAARNRFRFVTRLVHTGQHFSLAMSEAFFADLQLKNPDVNLGVSGGSQCAQTAAIMKSLEHEFAANRPDIVLVVGDVNSTLAAALVASKMRIRLAHVEAGLRSFDRSMPEEINRLVTDILADYLFASEPSGVRNLQAEGISKERIFFVGNVMIDTLLRFRGSAENSDILDRLGLKPNAYALLTLHRPSNVDAATRLMELIKMLEAAADTIPLVFPVHPRTRAVIDDAAIITERMIVTEPLGYLDFLKLQSKARVVLTDSGGVQEETTILGVPCLTLRNNTERPATIEEGTNRLVGTEPEKILTAFRESLDDSSERHPRRPQLWDGKAAARVLDLLEKHSVL